VESLLWRSPRDDDPPPSQALVEGLDLLKEAAAQQVYVTDRERLFEFQRKRRFELHEWLRGHFANDRDGPRDAKFLGLEPGKPFEVHTARFAHRTSPDGDITPQLLVGLLQESQQPVDPDDAAGPAMTFEGGCTIVADLRRKQIRYCIRKDLSSASRLERQQALAMREFDSLRSTYLGARGLNPAPRDKLPEFVKEPFAMIHRGQ